MEERKLTEQESLAIITQMITNAQANLKARIDKNMFLVWGYVAVGIAIILWIIKTYYPFPYNSVLWLLIPAICLPVVGYSGKKNPVVAKSYIDRIIDSVGKIYLAGFLILSLPSIWYTYPHFFMIALMVGMFILIIGTIIKEKIIIGGGITGMILSIAFLLIPNETDQLLGMAFFFLVVYVIPGHLFKNTTEKEQ